MNLGLEGKVAIVTGGSKGIGEAIVRGLIDEGVLVANVNRDGPEGPSLAAEFPDRCDFFAADLCVAGACEQAVAKAVKRFGRLDIVVNNAGVNDSVGLEDGVAAFRQSLDRNLIHPYEMVHHGLGHLKANRGVVINIGSKVAVTGQGGTSGYAAAKGGLNGLTREWALDLAAEGVRVNAVIPAEVWTPLYDKWLGSLEDPSGVRSAIERMIPLGNRFTTAQELADMVTFLASPRSSHTTGQIIYVDGGYTHFDRKASNPEF